MLCCNTYVKPAVQNLTSLDNNNHEETEEWILMEDLHIQDKKDFEQLLIPRYSYWQDYNQFIEVVNLTVHQRVKGNNKEHSNFRPLLNRAFNGDLTEAH